MPGPQGNRSVEGIRLRVLAVDDRSGEAKIYARLDQQNIITGIVTPEGVSRDVVGDATRLKVLLLGKTIRAAKFPAP